MTQLVQVDIDLIDANPFRNLKKYPFIERKLETLTRSMKAVGMWERIIARKAGDRYQMAFGHHTLEAGKRSGFKTVPLLVRDLDDEQMIQFMGRENLEDYNAEFMIMLEAWEAASDFSERVRKNAKAVDI